MSLDSRDSRHLIHALQQKLDKVATRNSKNWWEKYLRNSIEFRGVNIVKIRDEMNQWYVDQKVGQMSTRSQMNLAFSFFPEKYAEDKLAGVLFLQEHIIPKNEIGWIVLLSRIEEIFNGGYILDWNVCDWLCVRVIGPLVETNGKPCAEAVASWRNSENLWQARASVVSFVNMAKDGDQVIRGLPKIILAACTEVIRRSERFAKTGVGWVLRELSLSDREGVIKFIDVNREHFSKESLENAIKKLTPSEQEQLRSLLH